MRLGPERTGRVEAVAVAEAMVGVADTAVEEAVDAEAAREAVVGSTSL